MLKALTILFACYGLGCFIYFHLRLDVKAQITYDLSNSEPGEMVLQVQDAEENVEGLVREFVKTEYRLSQPHRLTVVDTGSQDQTKAILARLGYRYPYLSVQFCANQGEESPVKFKSNYK